MIFFFSAFSSCTTSPPSKTSLMASKIISSPIPPASTTPAFASAGSRLGVLSKDTLACWQISCITIHGSFVVLTTSLAFSADSLTTVRIVPSVGFITDLYAPFTPFSRLTTRSSADISLLPARPFEKPLKTRERITPEFPLAPLRSAEAIVLATAEHSTSSFISFSSARALPIVIDIFVPVSPSGTGNTLSSSTDFFLFVMLCAALIKASRSTLPSITVISSSPQLIISSINTFTDFTFTPAWSLRT